MRYESLLHEGPGDSSQSETQPYCSTMQTAQTTVVRLQQQTADQNIKYDAQYHNLFGTIFCRLVTFKINLLLPCKSTRVRLS